jgi:hypothetical protein
VKTVFDVAGSLSTSAEDIWCEDVEKLYLPFIINRYFSQHICSIMFANEMNKYPALTKRQQADFYRLAVQPKKKRFAKWGKHEVDLNIELISSYYRCNRRLAEQYAHLLSSADIEDIRQKMYRGGRG